MTFVILWASLVVALGYLVAVPAAGQDKASKIDELMNAFYQNRHFSGAVLVARGDSVIYRNAFGFADREWQIPNSVDTKFMLASVTKQFTTALVLRFVEQGKLRLDGKVTDYLPHYPSKNGDRITIHHLLSHTSGIMLEIHRDPYYQVQRKLYYSRQKLLDHFKNRDLLFDPGTRFQYSNFGYFLLALILEEVSGKTYSELLAAEIFGPLGTHNSGAMESGEIVDGLAERYRHWLGQGAVRAPHFDMSWGLASGNGYSTVEDLFKWNRALHTDAVLSEEYRQLMFTPVLNDF